MPGIESFAGDLSIAAAAQGLLRRFPLVDILVNDLGIFEPKAFGISPTRNGGGSSRSTCSAA